MDCKVYNVRNAKGVKLGKITVVTTTKNTICVVEWVNGGFMFFAGPAMIIFKLGQRELIVEFNGKVCNVGPCCKQDANNAIDDSAAYFVVLFDTGFRAMGDVILDRYTRNYITYLREIDHNGDPILADIGRTSWERVNPLIRPEPSFYVFEEHRLNKI